MSLQRTVLPVLPVVSLLQGENGEMITARLQVQEVLGSSLLEGGPFPFDMTDYYEPEMGRGLVRFWLCFPLADPARLADWKLRCIEIEGRHGGEGSRSVNLDPGYLDHGKLVLASCKEAPDKIYLRDGIYAHTCLRYGHGDFHAPDHSFADFRDGRFNGFFIRARQLYKKLLRER